MSDKNLFDKIKAGQSIVCTIAAAPRTPDQKSTLERLMRNDPEAKRGLRKGQRQRRQGMIVYNRGNRDWYKRELCSKIIHPVPGQTWSMRFTFDLANDFNAVKDLVTIKSA